MSGRMNGSDVEKSVPTEIVLVPSQSESLDMADASERSDTVCQKGGVCCNSFLDHKATSGRSDGTPTEISAWVDPLRGEQA